MPDRDSLIAMTEDRAAELADVQVATLRRWAEEGLVGATVVRHLSVRNTVRLYGFDDLVAILVLKDLQDVKSHQAMRAILGRLRAEYDKPLLELRFAVDVVAGEIYFQHADGTWEGDRKQRQTVMEKVLNLQEIKARIREQARSPRGQDEIGVVQRRRGRVGNKAVFSGTRIPVETVREYVAEGAEDAEILEAFPRLTAEDISLVRRDLAAQ